MGDCDNCGYEDHDGDQTSFCENDDCDTEYCLDCWEDIECPDDYCDDCCGSHDYGNIQPFSNVKVWGAYNINRMRGYERDD